MVKIAIAGGSGEVAREIIDVLVSTKRHDITVLSRRAKNDIPGTTWLRVNFNDKNDLVEALRGTHTVLSFIQLLTDPENKAQKNLIDAAIIAGVKRFAPSEWGSAATVGMPWWAGKDEIKTYLKKVNEQEKVLEYTLFQPGLFLNYLAFPHNTAKHLTPLNTMIDFENRRAIIVEGHDPVITLTTVQDLAAVVARAVDYDGEWPVIGGIKGNKVTVSQILEIGEKIRGRPFAVEVVKLQDLENGELTTSWSLEARHPSFTGEQAEEVLRNVLIGTLVSSVKDGWDVSDDWNRLLPDFGFTRIEDFLTAVWSGKP